jgi:hypothetical protein
MAVFTFVTDSSSTHVVVPAASTDQAVGVVTSVVAGRSGKQSQTWAETYWTRCSLKEAHNRAYAVSVTPLSRLQQPSSPSSHGDFQVVIRLYVRARAAFVSDL